MMMREEHGRGKKKIGDRKRVWGGGKMCWKRERCVREREREGGREKMDMLETVEKRKKEKQKKRKKKSNKRIHR